MDINWNLIKCALGRHQYGEMVTDRDNYILEKICKHCGKLNRLSSKGTYDKLTIKKIDIKYDIDTDSFCHAKQKLDNLLKELGY